MHAVRTTGPGRAPVLAEPDRPVPRGGEVLIRVEAAGVCGSDLHVIDAPQPLFARRSFTLGHEVAGRVVQVGPEAAAAPEPGERVAVYGPWGCGECRSCGDGAENYCERRAELGWSGVGLGIDGGMADYLLVPSARHLVPIGDLDAAQAAALCDAGLTSYHAIRGLRTKPDGNATVAVIGVGGLGHVAIQLLRELTAARVVALDVREEAVALARESGAHAAMLTRSATADTLRRIDAVLDFVGSDATLALATRMLRPAGELVIVGSAGGRLTVAKPGVVPPGFRLSMPYWGTRPDLEAVIALARRAAVRVQTECFPLSRGLEGIERLRSGSVRGRVVLMTEAAQWTN